MCSDTLGAAAQRVVALGATGSDAVAALRPALEAVFPEIVVEPGLEAASLGDRQPEGTTAPVFVCAASEFRSERVDEALTELPGARLVVVDLTGDACDPVGIQTHPGVTYVHAESPTEQLLATLQASLRTAGRSDGSASGADTASGAAAPEFTTPFPWRLFREAPLPLLVAEAETGTVIAANDRACELLGRSRESLLGITQDELHPDDTDTDYREEFRQSADTGGGDSYRQYVDPLYLETGDGDRVPVDIVDTTIERNGRTYVLGAFLDVSERVEEQAALRRRSTAMEASLTGISILDADGEYVYMNEAHADVFGYDPDELIGERWRTLYDEPTQAEIEADAFETLERTGSWEGELTGLKRNGDPVEHYISLTRLPDGGTVCVNRDISDRKRFERQLESIRDAARSFMLAADKETILDRAIELVTETLERPIVGYARYEPAADELRPVSVSPRSRELFDTVPTFERGEGLVWRAFESGQPRYYPDLEDVDGVYNPETPIRSELHVPVDDRGVFLIGSTTADGISANERKLLDIVLTHVRTALTLAERRTQLEQARERAESEREQLREVIDAVPQFVFAKNDAGEFIFANKAVADAYGTTPSELEGKTDADFAPNDADVEVFTEDDRRVIETGEPVYRYGETLTDVDGNERILETLKVPFDPIGTDGPAVLGSSTDVTELERAQRALDRLQRLKSLYKLESELRHRRTPAEVHEAGIDAVLEGLGDVVAATYAWVEADGVLDRTTATDDARFPETVTIGDGAYWRAFTTGQSRTLEDATGGEGYAVPIGSAGLLAVAGTDDAPEEVADFLRSIADTLAIAIDRSEQQASAEELRGTVDRLESDLDAVRTQFASAAETVDGILDAESRAELDRLLVEFIDTNWRYGWVGTYRPQAERVEPTVTTDDDGPAAELGGGSVGETPPALEAVRTRSPVYIDRTLSERDTEWAKTVLAYGYQSVLSVPIVDRGVIYGIVELASTDADGIDSRSIKLVRSLCRVAGRRLRQLSSDSVARWTAETVEVDVAFTDGRPLFPSLPAGSSLRVREAITVSSSKRRVRSTVRGLSRSEFEGYVSTVPGLHDVTFDSGGAETVFDAEVSLDTTRREPTEAFFDAIATEGVRVSSVSADPTDELVTVIGGDRSAVSAAVDALTALFDGATVLAKRAEGAGDTGADRPLEMLTDRQREILRTAYNRGYYDQPKGINGQALAELFDISHSTVHEHLSAAERKVMQAAVGEGLSGSEPE